MKDGVVIVGAGHAGVQAAASLREEGFDGPVILVGDENDLPYHKPPLSKAFIKDLQAEPQILRSEGFYAGAGIELRLGRRATRIDRQARRLELEDGSKLDFSHLILATGSRPRTLSRPGSGLSGIVSLRSLGDARIIRDLAHAVEDVVILGGGFIGLEVAATLSQAGRRVTVLEAQERLLGRVVAPEISAHVGARLAASGVAIMTGVALDGFNGAAGSVETVRLSDGRSIAAGLVIVGIGVIPNLELARTADLGAASGIPVDLQMRSAVPEILAIGDLATYRHWSTGADVRLESVQNAHDQAKLAARTVTGHADAFQSVPWFWSDIGDMKLQMVGLPTGSDDAVLVGEPGDNRFALFRYKGDRLVSIETVNRPGDHMLGRKMLAAGFSPERNTLEGGDLKATFAAWQAAFGLGGDR